MRGYEKTRGGGFISGIVGNTAGLKIGQRRTLERLARKHVDPAEIISRELSRALCALSSELKRQLGLLIHRSGKVETVIVGDHHQIVIPSLAAVRSAGGRLKGLRCVHTHLAGKTISDEDIMDMVLLRLDMMSVLTISGDLPDKLLTAHLTPTRINGRDWAFLPPVHPARQKTSCIELIHSLEDEFARMRPVRKVDSSRDRAILISVTTGPKSRAAERLVELAELARSADVIVLDTVIQRRRRIHPRFILGRGKLAEIMLLALRLGANLLIFDSELGPSQIRSITDHTELRVIDRTQLILDIFARRAFSREGKLQIEMAQLKYMLPRLSTRDDALSRLTGGIGARGPGETRLEIDRRRIGDRLSKLARNLKMVGKERHGRRIRRRKKNVPVISLVGYTNAGKSTLLNTLTNSSITAEDRLFATLDPTSRRLRFPREMEVIITDTVGFIRDLPVELFKAFQSTLEELNEADLLVHVIDISNPRFREQMRVVEDVLGELGLEKIPCLRAFNKIDLAGNTVREKIGRLDGVGICALDRTSLQPFLQRARAMIRRTMADKISAHQKKPE